MKRIDRLISINSYSHLPLQKLDYMIYTARNNLGLQASTDMGNTFVNNIEQEGFPSRGLENPGPIFFFVLPTRTMREPMSESFIQRRQQRPILHGSANNAKNRGKQSSLHGPPRTKSVQVKPTPYRMQKESSVETHTTGDGRSSNEIKNKKHRSPSPAGAYAHPEARRKKARFLVFKTHGEKEKTLESQHTRGVANAKNRSAIRYRRCHKSMLPWLRPSQHREGCKYNKALFEEREKPAFSARRTRHSNVVARTKGVSDESGHRKNNAFYDVHAVPTAGCSEMGKCHEMSRSNKKGDQNCSNAPCLKQSQKMIQRRTHEMEQITIERGNTNAIQAIKRSRGKNRETDMRESNKA